MKVIWKYCTILEWYTNGIIEPLFVVYGVNTITKHGYFEGYLNLSTDDQNNINRFSNCYFNFNKLCINNKDCSCTKAENTYSYKIKLLCYPADDIVCHIIDPLVYECLN